MEFAVMSRVVPPVDCFVVEIHTYQGADDGNSVFSVGPFKKGQDEESLESLVETLERVRYTFRRGSPTRETANHSDVLGFLHWFGPEEYSDMDVLRNEYPALVEKFGVEAHQELARLAYKSDWYSPWPEDNLRGLGQNENYPYETLNNYDVFYFDADGNKFVVEVRP